MKKIVRILFVFLIIIFIQCPSNYSETDNDLSVNEFIYYTMKDVYLWYDKIPEIDYKLYDDPEVLFESLLYKKYDNWSFIVKMDESLDLAYNEVKGYGFFPVWIDDSTNDLDQKWSFKIAYVKTNSPAYNNSLQRGDTIIHINDLYLHGLEPSDAINNLIYDEINKDEPLNLHIITKNNEDISVSLNRAVYTNNPIYNQKIIYQNGKKIGYLVFNSFDFTGDFTDDDNENDNQGLDNIFDNFQSNEIDELILDLRYNGGGSLSVAAHLASLICGEEYESKIFNTSYLNNRNYENYIAPYINSYYNYYYNEADNILFSMTPTQNYFIYKFEKLSTSLNLKRVIFITSDSSASASETLIMGLKPFVDVVLIGNNTHGKPVGMISIFYKDYVFYPIMFNGFNAIGEGDFFDGIEVDKIVNEDLVDSLGDIDEVCLKEALFYIDNNFFSSLKIRNSQIVNIPLKGIYWKNKCF